MVIGEIGFDASFENKICRKLKIYFEVSNVLEKIFERLSSYCLKLHAL